MPTILPNKEKLANEAILKNMDTNLEEINEFYSLNEFLRFIKWIDSELEFGSAREIAVQDYYAGVNFEEHWFEFNSIPGKKWRLVYPDGPFKGYWGEVL